MAEQKPGGAPLAGPSSVLVTCRSNLGPFHAWGRAMLRLPASAVPLVNTGMAPLTVQASPANPLRDGVRGTAAGGTVYAHAEGEVAPGGVTELKLTGTAPSRPGRYESTVRIAAGPAEPLVLPVAIEVAASPAWPLLFVLLGLAAAGAGAALSAAGDLRAKQAEVYELRQSLQERQARDPLPRRLQPDAAAIERGYALALEILARPAPTGFVDHRTGDAAAHLATAAARRVDLEKTLTGHAPGEAEIADLLALWATYKDVAADLGKQVPPEIPVAGAPSFVASVQLYLDRFVRRFVPGRIGYDGRQLEQVVLGVRLAASADRAQEAHERVQAARRWIGRGLDGLASVRALAETQRRLGFNLASNAAQTERALAEDGLPADVAAPIRRRLADAAALLARPARDGHDEDLAFRDANRAVHDAGTELIRAEAVQMLAAFKAAAVAPDGQDGLADINAAVAREQADPPHEPAGRIAGLRRIMAAWATKRAALPAAPDHAALDTAADAVVAALDADDLSQVSPRYRALTNAWADWDTRRTVQAAGATLRSGCERLARLTGVQIAQLTETLRQLAPRPERAAWETRAAQEAGALARYDPRMADSPSCLAPLNAIGERVTRLGGEVFRAALDDAPIGPPAKLAASHDAALRDPGLGDPGLGDPGLGGPGLGGPGLGGPGLGGPGLGGPGLGDVDSAPKPLGLLIETPVSERVTRRDIRFVLPGADPGWDEAAMLRVVFGDGTPPFLATLGAVRHGAEIVHRYEAAPAHPVVATLSSARAQPERLAEVTLPLVLAPSPAFTAQALADAFVNARFGLSLVIAITVYAWRFQSGKTIFGARGFDYVEAFATGFIVNAAVSNLPAELPRLLAKAGGG